MSHYGLDEQIDHLRHSGISFEIMSESDARRFLNENTYYFKIKAYRHNYKRDENGRYSCDFAHLVELSRIDISLSRLCLDHCLAIEHALKVWLNARLMNERDPGMAERIVRELGLRGGKIRLLHLLILISNASLTIVKRTVHCGIGGSWERSRHKFASIRPIVELKLKTLLLNICYSLLESYEMQFLTVAASCLT